MVIREDLVASAAKFLQDPSVASSPPENRVAFLQAKNLTPEEISAALARAGLDGSPQAAAAAGAASPAVSYPPPQQPPYYGGGGGAYGQPAPPPSYPPYGWQPAPPPEALPRRDWRDWFIMATVVGGVGYGLYNMTKRYVAPLVAPPTPDRLAQDKAAIDAQFERAFALVEQLAQDTEALKAAEQARTERLDQALAGLEAVVGELKTASKRREDDAERLRDDVRSLKDALPKALDTQRDVTDGRLREVNTELKGLRTLIGQRLGATAASNNGVYAPSVASAESEGAEAKAAATESSATGFVGGYSAANLGSASASANGTSATPSSTVGRASIPAWQRAMLKPSAPAANGTNGSSSSSSSANAVQPEATA